MTYGYVIIQASPPSFRHWLTPRATMCIWPPDRKNILAMSWDISYSRNADIRIVLLEHNVPLNRSSDPDYDPVTDAGETIGDILPVPV